MVRAAEARSFPVATILPWLTATSPRNAGSPEPSITRPFLISRSNAMFCPSSGCFARPWAGVPWVLRGLPPRFDCGPHLRHRIQGRDERLHLLGWECHEEG